MPNCTKCGQPLKEGAKFCGQCGAAVRCCSKCGHPLPEGAAFCGQCGAAANQGPAGVGAGVPPIAAGAAPIAEAPTSQAWVKLTLIFSNYLDMFGGFTCTILVDGQALRTIQMGETVAFAVLAGQHTIELVQVFSTLKIPITRKSDIELSIAAGTQAVVVAEYGRFFGKFNLKLQ